MSGIVKASNRNNYQVLFGETDNNVETEKASLLNMMNSGVDGILIAVSNSTTNQKKQVGYFLFATIGGIINVPASMAPFLSLVNTFGPSI